MADASRVRLKDRKITIADGPFTEAKEVVGGYALMEMKAKAEALEYARPAIHGPAPETLAGVRG